jgi:hypothetical protein
VELDAAEGQRPLSSVEVGLVDGDLQDHVPDVEQAAPGKLHRVQVAVGGDEDVRAGAHLRAVEDPELRAHPRGGADRAGICTRGLPGLGLDELANRRAVLEVRLRPDAEPLDPLLPPPEHRADCKWAQHESAAEPWPWTD